jgi:hypothetical protein
MTLEVKEIKIADCSLILSKDFISDTKKVEIFSKELDGLKNLVLDLSTKDKIKEAKLLRTEANKFVGELKDFCEPLEAEGQRIKDARSIISTKLNKSKSSVIEALLAPIDEREAKVKSIKDKLFIPSLDANSNQLKLKDLEELSGYEWFGFAEEIVPVIERQKEFLLNEKIKFDAEVKAALEVAEKARLDREEFIRVEAEKKAMVEAQKLIDDANKKVEEAEKQIQEVKLTYLTPKKAVDNDVERQKVVHNEILADLDFFIGDLDLRKAIIKAIANGKIRNLTINY